MSIGVDHAGDLPREEHLLERPRETRSVRLWDRRGDLRSTVDTGDERVSVEWRAIGWASAQAEHDPGPIDGLEFDQPVELCIGVGVEVDWSEVATDSVEEPIEVGELFVFNACHRENRQRIWVSFFDEPCQVCPCVRDRRWGVSFDHLS